MGNKKTSYYELLISLSGIPREEAEKEFAPYFESLKLNPLELSLNDIRKILALYLHDLDKSMVEGKFQDVSQNDKKDFA